MVLVSRLRPALPYSNEPCTQPNRLLIRTASNAYFSQIMSVISLPSRDEDVKEAEFEVLASTQEEIGEDRPDGDFYARSLAQAHWDGPRTRAMERVVLLHRLREVVALAGFSRFEPLTTNIHGELSVAVQRARLAREESWLPAVENRGEGIFLSFDRDQIDAWLRRRAVVQRGNALTSGFNAWLEDHPNSRRAFFGLPYVLLHSLSHLLITQVSLECGYPASSIRERIYASDYGYGILLYTGTPDAEGTLGGLVEAGRRIRDHLLGALERGALCSNDPVCAQHDPADLNEKRFLQGAACHGCLLIAETSCEQRNDFLDRTLVVPTVDERGAAFFEEAIR